MLNAVQQTLGLFIQQGPYYKNFVFKSQFNVVEERIFPKLLLQKQILTLGILSNLTSDCHGISILNLLPSNQCNFSFGSSLEQLKDACETFSFSS